ncbi:MAG: polymer-forming cytoskeletal protein [Sedimentisphaerales bacterium]|nr:polymer-forming cytoskeletal protein [Sedimentisphaerales bacterium]
MSESDFPTVIGPDARFKGELHFEKGVKILGGFEGRITTDGTLVVAPEGVLQADIEAGSITIEGEISGNVAAKDLVELKDTARLQGDLKCDRLIVVDGARFVGHCDVGNGRVNQPSSVTAEPASTPESVSYTPPVALPTGSDINEVDSNTENI